MNPWTDTSLATLRRLWPDPNISCSGIAEQIEGVSRNAVIGKAKRLGLGPKPTNDPRGQRNPASKHVPRPQKPPRNFGGVWSGYPDKAESFVPREADIIPLNLSILEVNDSTCKFGYGDGPFTFCGHPVAPGKVYCAPHCRITYTSPKERTPAQQANDARMADVGRARVMTRAPHKYMVEELA